MANPTYIQGTVTVGTTPTKIATIDAGTGGVYLSATASVVLGGSNVTTTGATAGPTLGTTGLIFPTAGGPVDLYGITASGTASVSFAYAPA